MRKQRFRAMPGAVAIASAALTVVWIGVAPSVAIAQTTQGLSNATCRDTVRQEGGYSISRTYADKVKSLFAWRKAAGEKYGTDFQNWSAAASRRVTCTQRQIVGVGRRWVCLRTARACAAASGAATPLLLVNPGEVFGSATLKRGSKGRFVKNLQRTLQDLRYDVTIDGKFGPATEQAVRRFQGDKRLVIDGKVGPATKRVLLS